MRTLLTTMGLVAVIVVGASARQNSEKAEPAKVCTINVSGMFCGACAKTVEKTVKKVDGVRSAKVSQPKGTAEITYDPAKTTPEAIAKIIREKTSFKAEASRQ